LDKPFCLALVSAKLPSSPPSAIRLVSPRAATAFVSRE
jgi:hypothetical protein